MTLLNNNDLTYTRAQAETLLPDTCDIQERQQTSDEHGGFTLEWSTTYQNVPCRLSERQTAQEENVRGGRMAGEAEWTSTLPYDQAIDRSDRIVHNGHTYDVTFVNSDRSHDTTRRVLLTRIS